MSDIAVTLPGLKMKNPLMPASGTFGFGDTKTAQSFDLNKMGAMVLKTTTVQATKGNPQPQIHVLADGVLNSVGLTNPGVEVVATDKVNNMKNKYPGLPLIASVGGNKVEDYVKVAKRLEASNKVDALEINISCPNVAKGGMHFGTDPKVVESLTRKIRDQVKLPIYVKLTPNVTSVAEIAKAAVAGGADGISLINTVLGLDYDIKTRKPVLGKGMGGLSGQAVRPIALRMVRQVYKAVNVPIIGMGGIYSAEDVVKFFLAGANAVAVGSMHFTDSLAIPHLAQKLPDVLDRLGVNSITDLIGEGEDYC